jgi:hypothetical protein
MNTLRESLEHMPTNLLREMAQAWEVPEAEKAGRPNLISGLLAQMAQEEAIQSVLRKLDRQERDLLRQLLAAGGRMPAATLVHTYGQLRSANLAPADWGALNPLERLHRRGLLFRGYSAWEGYRGPAFFVPAELWPFLPRIPRATPEDLLQPLPPSEVETIPPDFSLHYDMAVLLALFRREAYLLTEDGQCPPGLRALESLVVPLPAYVHFLFHVARQARLLGPDLEGVLRPTAEGQQWLRTMPALRIQVLFQAWRDHPGWDDLATIPELLIERPWPADFSLPRGRVLRQLATCPPEAWLAQTNWAQVVEAADPEFLRPGGTSNRVRVRARETGSPLEGVTSWAEVEGRYLRFLLQGPLQWLELVEVGESPARGAAFRLTPLGQALLHPEAGLPAIAEEPAIVEGTSEVWVPIEASPYVVFLLECYAERVRRDHVSQYRLTRPALHRALQRGERLETLLEALARYGRGEVPQNVAYTLKESAAAYGRFRLRPALLLTTTEAILLDEVLADAAVQAACAERLSPTAVEVTPGRAADLEERLGELGHLPEIAEGLLSRGERFALTLTSGEGVALLALLWTWEEAAGQGETGRTLFGLAEAVAQRLSPAAKNRAKRLKEHLARALKENPQ